MKAATLFSVCSLALTVFAQEPRAPLPPDPVAADVSDKELVRRALLDYVEGIYEVQPDRIARSVHPELVKFGFARGSADKPYVGMAMTYEQLHGLAGSYNAEGRIPADAPKIIAVLAVLDEIACAKLIAHWGVDYMQLTKVDGTWKITHVMWQTHPAEPEAKFEASPEETAAVKRAGLDYVEAFYEAKPELIERSVHAGLTKYGFYRPEGAQRSRPMAMSFEQLRDLASRLHANSKPPADAPKEVMIHDMLDQTALVEVVGTWGIDYMHVAKFDGKWKILHVLWQSHPVAEKDPVRR